MVCIQCYLPPILFMIYMKVLHPFVAPFLEPAIDKVVGWIWGPQAVQRGCPIKPRNITEQQQKEGTPPAAAGGSGDQVPSTSSSETKPKGD